MKRIYKDHAERQGAYRQRQKEKQEAAAEEADEKAQCVALDLRFFGESAFDHNAETAKEEIQIHRSFLRALGQPDVQQNETLRQLGKRTWDALLNAERIGIDKWPVHLRDSYKSGYDVWIPMFDPKTQDFQGWHGYSVRGAMKPDWFETHWTAPKDCTGDEIISIEDLPALPMKTKKLELKQSESKPKTIEPPVPSTQQILLDARVRLSEQLRDL